MRAGVALQSGILVVRAELELVGARERGDVAASPDVVVLRQVGEAHRDLDLDVIEVAGQDLLGLAVGHAGQRRAKARRESAHDRERALAVADVAAAAHLGTREDELHAVAVDLRREHHGRLLREQVRHHVDEVRRDHVRRRDEGEVAAHELRDLHEQVDLHVVAEAARVDLRLEAVARGVGAEEVTVVLAVGGALGVGLAVGQHDDDVLTLGAKLGELLAEHVDAHLDARLEVR